MSSCWAAGIDAAALSDCASTDVGAGAASERFAVDDQAIQHESPIPVLADRLVEGLNLQLQVLNRL
jgi:hypothetical protein